MARLRVTGYIEVDDLDGATLDSTDDTGLSEKGYNEVLESLHFEEVIPSGSARRIYLQEIEVEIDEEDE